MPDPNDGEDKVSRRILAHWEQEVLAAREWFLKTFKTYPLDAAQKLTPMTHWQEFYSDVDSGRDILSVTHDGQVLFPAFQWHDGKLVPSVSAVSQLFRNQLSQWEIALWLVEPTGWLGDRAPVDMIITDPAAVMLAAHRVWAQNANEY